VAVVVTVTVVVTGTVVVTVVVTGTVVVVVTVVVTGTVCVTVVVTVVTFGHGLTVTVASSAGRVAVCAKAMSNLCPSKVAFA
jgi:hypothetical protein